MTLWIGIAIVAHVLGFISSVVAMMTARTPQGSIAWAISLNTCPYIAVPAYWVFGRSRFEGYVTARKLVETDLEEKYRAVLESVAPYRVPEMDAESAGHAAELLAGVPFLKGNEIELLIDGEATFDSILEGIDAAEHYILFQFFIVHDDELGRRVKRHLVAKAKQGVRVYFLYDEIGSHDLPGAYLSELRAAGIAVRAFNSRKGIRNRFQVNFRNHRKLVVVDGETAWIGGHNVGDEYLGKDPTFGHWRDTHVRISGPAVLGAQFSFSVDWRWAADQEIPELKWTPTASPSSDGVVLIIPSGPADETETALLMFLHAINSAQKRIWISSPYFIPDDAVLSALQLAGLRGVEVKILIPDIADHEIPYLAAFSYFDEATLTGTEIYRYTNGFLHGKAMLIDDQMATVGSANFDNRSFRLNFEITAACTDAEFIQKVEEMFADDFSNARKMIQADIDEKSFWFKLKVRAARLTAPVQ